MEKQPFDKAIKSSLKHLKVEFNVDHWQQMEMLLHNLPIGKQEAINAHFDALIKDKIKVIEQPPTAPTTLWAGVEAGLIQAEAADLQFDEVINDHIADLQGATPSNWANMEEALNLEEAVDAQFDTQIYSKLRNLHPTAQPSHWQRLVARLNSDLALREKLYRYKLIEATLMILLLLNFYQYLPSNYSFITKNKVENKKLLERVLEKEQPPTVVPTPKIKSDAPAIQQNRPVAVKANKKPLIAATVPPKILEAINTTSPTTIPRNDAIAPSISILTPTIGQRNGLSISVSEMNHHLTLHTETGNSLIGTVPSLRPNFVESQYITPLGCKDCKFPKIPARLRLGIVANLAITNAYVSGGDILDINAFAETGFGYGTGASLGFKYGRWEIETGLVYAAKQYNPNIVDLPRPNEKRTHFQTVHLQTLHIPANLRYNYAVLGKGRWHLYAQTGAALNVILRVENDLAEVSAISRTKVNDITTSRISQIDFNTGLLGGDGFKANRYLSISMGAGVERYISPSWSIFVQPDFHFHFSGNRIGPTEDRINTLSLSFGARKSL